MSRVGMALRLIRGSQGLDSRLRLAGYFGQSLGRRVRRGRGHSDRIDRSLRFRLGGVEWEVMTESSQLGGIHDVWLGGEYDAVPGFRAGAGSVVVDVGANVGAYALWQYRNMGGHGVVIAAEASPRTFDVLRRNVELNGAGSVVECVPRAIWREAGEVEFLASLRQSSTSGIAETADLELLQQPTSVSVQAITLMDLFDSTGLGQREIGTLKIDVEGAELEIIRASSHDAMRRVRRVVVETADVAWPAVRTLMEEIGFRCVGRHRSVGFFASTDS